MFKLTDMKKIAFILMVFMVGNGQAQNIKDTVGLKKASIAFKVGMFDFKKTNQTNLSSGVNNSAVQIGVQYLKGIKPNLDLMVSLDVTSLKYPFYVSSKIATSKDSRLYSALDISANYKLGTDEQKLVPFVTAGLGIASYHNAYYTGFVPVGAGLQIKAAHGSYINIISTYRAEATALTKMHYNHSISYSLPIKGKDKKAILLPPAPVKLDADDDGVIDSVDQCPTQNGMKKYMGCPVPDTDEDGVNDENDKCPTQEGTIKYAGCPVPDKDKDGIPDDKDKCPGNSGLTRYNGCPIPDSDHDGVNDEEDKCPNFAGVSSNKGCVDFQPIVDKATSNLKFASGKIDLLKKQLTPLNEVVALLKDNPTVRIVINGHTDNTGSRNINDKLSLQRAKVVQRFVLSKGIDQNRVSIMGYADTKPISDNATLKGRAENRRTDITVLYN